MKKANQRDLDQFVAAVKTRLGSRLEAVSLELLDLGLKKGKAEVLTPGAEIFILIGWVKRTITGEVKDFNIRFGADIGDDTQPGDVDELCKAIVDSCLLAFYPKVASA